MRAVASGAECVTAGVVVTLSLHSEVSVVMCDSGAKGSHGVEISDVSYPQPLLKRSSSPEGSNLHYLDGG